MNNTHTTPPATYVLMCLECNRMFDMCDAADAAEYADGHDCEA